MVTVRTLLYQFCQASKWLMWSSHCASRTQSSQHTHAMQVEDKHQVVSHASTSYMKVCGSRG